MGKDSMRVAGIDTGKANLDIALHPGGETLRVENRTDGHARLIGFLSRHGIAKVGIEASGGYERDVVDRLCEAGFQVVVLQPRQVRAFAVYKLRRAKNDRLDAALIAASVEGIAARLRRLDPRLQRFAEDLRLIGQIEADLVRARTRKESFREPRLQKLQEHEIARLEGRRKAEIALLAKEISKHDDLSERLALIDSVEGIGLRTALTLLIDMPELGSLSREEAACLAGLAPFDRESGSYKGKRHIAGGRASVRRALFAAALPATFRWNPALRDLYQRLTAAGKPHKKALTACARKLLTFANAVLQRRTAWTPATVPT